MLLNDVRPRAPSFRPVRFGTSSDDQLVHLTHDDLKRHTQIIGQSDRGKSKGLELTLRQFLLNGVGFTLIDPHGSLVNSLLRFVAYQPSWFTDRRKIHLFDPKDTTWRFGYNPFYVPEGLDPEHRDSVIIDKIEALLMAVAQVMGGEDPDRMPRFAKMFTAILYAAATKGLTLFESMQALPRAEGDFRNFIAADLPDPIISMIWKSIRELGDREYDSFFDSTESRMVRLLRHPVIREVLSQTNKFLKPAEVMENGEVVLLNFQQQQGAMSKAAGDLLGRLLINDYVQTALSRVADRSRPHFLVIDECYRFITHDIEDLLDQTRKYGLYAMLAHQRLSQLGEPNDPRREGVLYGAQNKVIFGVTHKTALELVDDIYGHEYDFERVKERVTSPVVVAHKRELLEAFSEGENESASWARNTSTATGGVVNYNKSVTEGYDYPYAHLMQIPKVGQAIHWAKGNTIGEGESWQNAQSETGSGGTTATKSRSSRETLIPEIEERAMTPHSLPELQQLHAREMSQLQQQHCIVRTARGVIWHTLVDWVVERYCRTERLKALCNSIQERSGSCTLITTVKQVIQQRHEQILRFVSRHARPKVRDVPENTLESMTMVE